jgi:DNA-binding NtrC family response regulator
VATNVRDLRALRLDVYTGDTVTSHVLPAHGQVLIGRAEGADVRVDHPSVSRRHVILHLGPPLRVEDLGGANGTSVRNPGAPATDGATEDVPWISGRHLEITVGSVITVGTTMMVLRRTALAPADEGSAGEGFVAEGPAMAAVRAQALLAARSSISVLLLGETGAGKDVMARAIHQWSARADEPFVGLHCAALPESLLESELFGHEKGSFTGALASRPGLFEAAHGGTVFLDEIGELSLAAQVKLLRILETREVTRVGGRSPVRVDVRFIAATHRDLPAAVTAGSFRADLYFRLDGLTLTIPPLRERVSEILPLATRFVESASAELDRAAPPRLSPEARAMLERYPWPGNVRELKNAIERAIVLCPGDTLGPEQLPARLGLPAQAAARAPEDPDARERRRVLDALQSAGGNQGRAAELLGISRRTLVYRLSAYGLTRRRSRVEAPEGGVDDEGEA